MRINVLVATAMIGFSAFAFAQPKADAFDVSALNLTDGTTPYQAISNWYKTATSVPFSEINNHVMAGRCFEVTTPTTPVINLVVGLEMTVGPDDGPAFPKALERKVALLSNPDGRADRDSLIDFMKSNWAIYEQVLASDVSPLWYNQSNVMGEVKRFGNYLVSVSALNQDETCTGDNPPLCMNGGTMKKGTPAFACYFYQELN